MPSTRQSSLSSKPGVRAGFAPVETRFAEVNAGLRVIVGLLEGRGGPAARSAD
jgi:hypothetical protein